SINWAFSLLVVLPVVGKYDSSDAGSSGSDESLINESVCSLITPTAGFAWKQELLSVGINTRSALILMFFFLPSFRKGLTTKPGLASSKSPLSVDGCSPRSTMPWS
ncbi:MAG: hypothetical protein RIB86_20005, partial [Imperialibacter sp.]